MEILLKEKFYALCQNKFWKRCEIFFLFFFFSLFSSSSSSFLLRFFFISSDVSHTFKRGRDILRGNCFGLIDVKKGGRGVVWKGPRENRHTEKDSERDFLSWPFTPLILSHKINSFVYKLTSSIQMYFWLSVFSSFHFFFLFYVFYCSLFDDFLTFFFFSFSLFYKTSRFPSFSLFSSFPLRLFHLLVIFFFLIFVAEIGRRTIREAVIESSPSFSNVKDFRIERI